MSPKQTRTSKSHGITIVTTTTYRYAPIMKNPTQIDSEGDAGKQAGSPGFQNRCTKLLGKMCLPSTRRFSSSSSPLHHPSSGVAVTAMISLAWKSNSSGIVAE